MLVAGGDADYREHVFSEAVAATSRRHGRWCSRMTSSVRSLSKCADRTEARTARRVRSCRVKTRQASRGPHRGNRVDDNSCRPAALRCHESDASHEARMRRERTKCRGGVGIRTAGSHYPGAISSPARLRRSVYKCATPRGWTTAEAAPAPCPRVASYARRGPLSCPGPRARAR